jgi:hypothetical protein
MLPSLRYPRRQLARAMSGAGFIGRPCASNRCVLMIMQDMNHEIHKRERTVTVCSVANYPARIRNGCTLALDAHIWNCCS